MSFSHIFLSERRGNDLEGQAKKLLTKLRDDPASQDNATGLSDPFPLGIAFRAYPRSRIAARFGEQFAGEVFTLEAGTWFGPIESPFGLHLVRIDEKQAPQMPPLQAIIDKAAVELVRNAEGRAP